MLSVSGNSYFDRFLSEKLVSLSVIKNISQNIMKKISLLFLSFLSGTGLCHAQSYTPISLPSMFADHMVLQQNSSASVWGWGNASSTVKIVGSWAEKDTVSAMESRPADRKKRRTLYFTGLRRYKQNRIERSLTGRSLAMQRPIQHGMDT